MTIRQRLLRLVYPMLMKATGKTARVLQNKAFVPPAAPFYGLSATLNTGAVLSFETLKEKKVLLVNTASDCGYTAQYGELQQLQQQYAQEVVVIGFPANDFKEQEKGTDDAIAQFCQVNFGVTFPLAKKSSVTPGPHQHPVYQWLTDPSRNGWNNQPPGWNFAKYLVNEKGVLTHYFDAAVPPLSAAVTAAIKGE